MIGTHRLLLLLIAINMVTGFAMEIYHDPTNENNDQITTEQQLMEQYEEEIQSNEGIWGGVKRRASDLFENTIGNPIKWGYTILKIFIRGLNPFSFSASDFTHPIEQAIANILILFRSLLMGVVVGVSAYMFFKNKSTN